MEIKRVAEEQKFWNKEKKAAKSEEEVPEYFYQ